jgi:hypothetical protein
MTVENYLAGAGALAGFSLAAVVQLLQSTTSANWLLPQ